MGRTMMCHVPLHTTYRRYICKKEFEYNKESRHYEILATRLSESHTLTMNETPLSITKSFETWTANPPALTTGGSTNWNSLSLTSAKM